MTFKRTYSIVKFGKMLIFTIELRDGQQNKENEKEMPESTENKKRTNCEKRVASENSTNEDRIASDFLEYLSRDLRRPLVSVKKMNANARQMIENGRYEKAVILTGQIENSMDYLLSLIENILDMAELRKNGVALKKRQFDMKQMVKSCNAHISSLCRQKAISCMWVSSVDGQYIGDKKRLSQCVVNFLENAVKFNKKGGRIRVDIGKWTSTESESEDKFIIQIYDNGIGMSPEQMESMYLPFVKNKIHEGDMEASPGIGLTVSKMILDAMNGKIEVCSELQYGTTIILYFSLPRVEKLPKSVDNLEDKMYTQV